MSDYSIQKKPTLHLVLRLCRAKEQRKKPDTTPKKDKHPRKKVSLAALVYYRMDEMAKLVPFVRSTLQMNAVMWEILWPVTLMDMIAANAV